MAQTRTFLQFSRPQLAETTARPKANFDNAFVSTLDCNEFVEWLRAKNIPLETCEAFRGNYSKDHCY